MFAPFLLISLWSSSGYSLENTPTPRSLHQSRNDVLWTGKVQREIAKDQSISPEARNVEVYINGGLITLKGRVRSENEKKQVEELAAHVVNQKSISNELIVGGSL